MGKGSKILGHYGIRVNRHSEALAEESFLKGAKLLRHYGTKSNCHPEQLTAPDCHAELVSASVRGETLKQCKTNSRAKARLVSLYASAVQGDNAFVYGVKGVLKKCAFTLAEVLIVLAVLGVVAAMTIPDLIQDYREKATVTAVKKAYTVLSQAVDMGVANNGPVETWDWGTGYSVLTPVNVFSENIIPYLRIEKDCGKSKGCWYDGYIKKLSGQNDRNIDLDYRLAKVVLEDGTSVSFLSMGDCSSSRGSSTALRHTCGEIYIDTNGKSNPNTLGKDVFGFWITREGIIPMGGKYDSGCQLKYTCRINGTGTLNGIGCTAWVIKKENMDYLRKIISW